MIYRDLAGPANRTHDLIVIGGGIYGACVALEAARRGARPLLLERGDFGGATSWNSMRLLHGGFRYLQHLDLPRFRESVAERQWFCRTFPDLVRTQECLIPLYGDGLKRPGVLAAALRVEDWLSSGRNRDVDPDRHISRGRVLSVAETVVRFPGVDRRGLRGGGLWCDAAMVSSQRVLIEILRWAASLGATVLNYVNVTELVVERSRVVAVRARDVIGGSTYLYAADRVCNCAGPWSSELVRVVDEASETLFRPSLAFNLLLDREPPSRAALAVVPRQRSAHRPVYFVYPAFGGVLAGTVHLRSDGPVDSVPREEHVDRFVTELGAAIPGWDVRLEHVRHVFSGLLPATAAGTTRLAVRPIVRDHARLGGPAGLVSVSGVKFTTARSVAERAVALLARGTAWSGAATEQARPPSIEGLDFDNAGDNWNDQTIRAVRQVVDEEAVMTIDDLLLRRTNWGIVTPNQEALRQRVAAAMGWRLEDRFRPGVEGACGDNEISA